MKVSIIMPVYNASKYLYDSIDSILKQSFSDFELIIINDGSIDNSLDIINNFIKKDNRISVFTIKNAGVSNARNIGLDHAKGEYILFVDSDDTVDSDFIKYMYDSISTSDLAICGYYNYFTDRKIPIVFNSKISNINDLQLAILTNNIIGGFCCNKMFKRKIIYKYNLRFNTNIFICEDLLFVFQYISKITCYNYISIPLYNYRMRKSSATMSKNYNRCLTELLSYEEIVKLNVSDAVKNYIFYRYLKTFYKIKTYYKKIKYDNNAIILNQDSILKKMNFNEKLRFYLIKIGIYNYIDIFRLRINRNKYFD